MTFETFPPKVPFCIYDECYKRLVNVPVDTPLIFLDSWFSLELLFFDEDFSMFKRLFSDELDDVPKGFVFTGYELGDYDGPI